MRKYPDLLFQTVCWSFAEPAAASPDAFLEQVRAYAMDIGDADPVAELTHRLPFFDVRLRYEYGVRGPDGEWTTRTDEVRVVGPLGSLTGAELLWELHLACHATVGDDDHHFFEGLELRSAGTADGPPSYDVLLGS